MRKISLFPTPKQTQYLDGTYNAECPLEVPAELAALETVFDGIFRIGGAGIVQYFRNGEMNPEGYCLEIQSDGIRVESADSAGRFYAMVTLGQLLEQGRKIPCCRIQDAPALGMRGYMLDVSRGRIPNMQKLRTLVDLLAKFKYNQLQLYIEGFSFEYTSFPECMEGHTPLTGTELRELDEYCKMRHMELVPNQNCLGHMAPWLARPEFRHLAEREEDVELFGRKYPPTTLDAADPGSLALVERMFEDLLPNFTSRWVNVNMDEAFELGKGKNAEYAAAYGKDRLFLSYAKKLHGYFSTRGWRMMMWADAAADSGLLRDELPADILMLEWGYEAEHPYVERAEALKKAGRSFCVSPGTSSWSSFTGNTDNMLKNITTAMDVAARYGAEGMLLTEWGDMGHLQPPAVNWPGMVYAGCLAWNLEQPLDEAELARALDLFIFRDQSGTMGRLLLDMGRYNRKESFRLPCRTLACMPILLGPMPADTYATAVNRIATAFANMAPPPVAKVYLTELEHRKTGDTQGILADLEEQMQRLENASPCCKNAALIVAELRCALKSVWVLTRAHDLLLRGETNSALAASIDEVVESYRRIWPARAKPDGLENSLTGFTRLAAHFKGGAVQ